MLIIIVIAIVVLPVIAAKIVVWAKNRNYPPIEHGEMNRAIDHIAMICHNEGLLNFHDWEHCKKSILLIPPNTTSDVGFVELEDGLKSMRADMAVNMLSKLDPRYHALFDHRGQMDIEEREHYIYSVIVNEYGYEPN